MRLDSTIFFHDSKKAIIMAQALIQMLLFCFEGILWLALLPQSSYDVYKALYMASITTAIFLWCI